MADAKITALTALTTPALADLLPIVDDVAGTPITKKITVEDLARGGADFTIPTLQWVAQDSTSSLAAQAAAQSVFDDANDALTVVASTAYLFDGLYIITTGQTSHTTLMGFALGGGASVSSFVYTVSAQATTAVGITNITASTVTTISGVAHVQVMAAQTTNDTFTLNFRGVMRINAGGTLTPQISFSANPTGTNVVEIGSYITVTPLGPTTRDFAGAWA